MAKVSRTKSARSSAAARKKGGKAGQRAARGSGQVANLAGTDPQHAARGVDRQDRAASSDHLLQGYIDEASSSRITGWVWNPQQPDSPITLDLADGDTRLARVMANQYRSDLRQTGIGDGRHAFAVPLGEELLPSARNVLHLRCAETGMEVPGSPVIIERSGVAATSQVFREPHLSASEVDQLVVDPVDQAAVADQVADKLPVRRRGKADRVKRAMPRLVSKIEAEPGSDTALKSNIDSADWTGVRGWVWDPQEPLKPVELELLDGDAALVTVLANEYRADLEKADIGDGRHGFSISFNETLLPNARHVLHLRPVGSKVEIASFPLVLTREQAGLDASVRFILGNVMAEADRAEKAEDLAPIINAMVGFLDAALSRYFYIAEEAATNVAELLEPAELSSHVRILINSIQRSYPPIVVDSRSEPLVSIIIPVFNKFDLTYNCVKSIWNTERRSRLK